MLLEPLVIDHLRRKRAHQARRVQTQVTYEPTNPNTSEQANAEVNGHAIVEQRKITTGPLKPL